MLKPDYKALWSSMIVNDKMLKGTNLTAQHIIQFKDRYQTVGNITCPHQPVPWYFIGLIHHMESGQSFSRHLHNGDPLTARTVHVPKGMPLKGNPPFTWEESALDTLVMMGYGSPKIWDIDDVLARLESYNGTGYQKHDIYTPYLWSGTNHYDKGYYLSDGNFAPNATSQQIGCAPILSFLLNYDQK